MARRSYNKLVRDKVPTAIVQGGDEAVTSVLESRLHKRETRGGFTKMILLEEIIE